MCMCIYIYNYNVYICIYDYNLQWLVSRLIPKSALLLFWDSEPRLVGWNLCPMGRFGDRCWCHHRETRSPGAHGEAARGRREVCSSTVEQTARREAEHLGSDGMGLLVIVVRGGRSFLSQLTWFTGSYCASWITWDPTNDLAFEYLSKAAQPLGLRSPWNRFWWYQEYPEVHKSSTPNFQEFHGQNWQLEIGWIYPIYCTLIQASRVRGQKDKPSPSLTSA